jgi:ribosomal 50S subunit-associated protein YjgA (DUF615 family)
VRKGYYVKGEFVASGSQTVRKLREAIGDSSARDITSPGARRRQMEYVGKLLRRLDDEAMDAIRAAVAQSFHRRA